jgi:hypothetical protein
MIILSCKPEPIMISHLRDVMRTDLARSTYIYGILTLRALIAQIPLHGRKSTASTWLLIIRSVDSVHCDFCSHVLDTIFKAIIPDVMWGSGEFQAGAFDPWGGVSVF